MGSLKTEKFKEIRKEQCPQCAKEGRDTKGNKLSVYEDESAYCWNPQCTYKISNAEAAGKGAPIQKAPNDPNLVSGVFAALDYRGLTQATAEKFNVRVSGDLTIFPVYRGGIVVRQKVKNKTDKSKQRQVGDMSCNKLFGMNCFIPTDRIGVTLTEGEEDAMAVFQSTGYPAVSGLRGAKGIKSDILANLEWLMQWKHVNLCFDNDEAGQAMIEECASLFEAGKVRIVRLPLKDANEMVLAKRSAEVKQCLWDSTIHKPATLVSVSDVWDSVLVKPSYGEPWPFKSMTEITYGLQWGDVYLLAAAKGIGKTQFLQELVIQQLQNNVKVGLFCLEQRPEDSIRRFVGGLLNKRLHLPTDTDWDEAKIKETMEGIKDNIVLCDKGAGTLTIESVLINIRYANKCFGTKFFIIDNLKKLAANPTIAGVRTNRVQFMGHVMTQLSELAVQLRVTMFVVQHLNSDKPNVNVSVSMGQKNNMEDMTEGLAYESGRMPTMMSIYGAGDITDLVDHVMVLSRNRNSKDMVVKCKTTVKFLQTRLDGTKDGASFPLYYSPHTGRMTEEMPLDLVAMENEKRKKEEEDKSNEVNILT